MDRIYRALAWVCICYQETNSSKRYLFGDGNIEWKFSGEPRLRRCSTNGRQKLRRERTLDVPPCWSSSWLTGNCFYHCFLLYRWPHAFKIAEERDKYISLVSQIEIICFSVTTTVNYNIYNNILPLKHCFLLYRWPHSFKLTEERDKALFKFGYINSNIICLSVITTV